MVKPKKLSVVGKLQSERSLYIRKYKRGLRYYARKQSIIILYKKIEDYLFYTEEVEVTESMLEFIWLPKLSWWRRVWNGRGNELKRIL